MDVKHKHVYGYVKVAGIKDAMQFDVGGIAMTLSHVTKCLYDSNKSMRGDIEIILSLTPHKPDSELTPGERASREFVAQHRNIIQSASAFEEQLATDPLLLEYWTMCLTQDNFDKAIKAYRVGILTEHVEMLYHDSPFWANELLISRENLEIFAPSYIVTGGLFSEDNS